MLALPPFSFLLCLSPFFLPPAEKMEDRRVFTRKLLLSPHSVLCCGACLCGCAPSSTAPPHFVWEVGEDL